MSRAKSNPVRRRWGSPWTPEEVEVLGKHPDSVLARRWGRTIKEVLAERERRRIRLVTPPRRWTQREIRLLGTLNDYELARRLSRPKHEVRRQRRAFKIPPFKPRAPSRFWKAAELKLLGTMPDAELARRLRRTELSVAVQRRKLGIAKPDAKVRPHRPWSETEIKLLGQFFAVRWPAALGANLTT
jgi:hypothetical protein